MCDCIYAHCMDIYIYIYILHVCVTVFMHIVWNHVYERDLHTKTHTKDMCTYIHTVYIYSCIFKQHIHAYIHIYIHTQIRSTLELLLQFQDKDKLYTNHSCNNHRNNEAETHHLRICYGNTTLQNHRTMRIHNPQHNKACCNNHCNNHCNNSFVRTRHVCRCTWSTRRQII